MLFQTGPVYCISAQKIADLAKQADYCTLVHTRTILSIPSLSTSISQFRPSHSATISARMPAEKSSEPATKMARLKSETFDQPGE
jgi:hypothetical protein